MKRFVLSMVALGTSLAGATATGASPFPGEGLSEAECCWATAGRGTGVAASGLTCRSPFPGEGASELTDGMIGRMSVETSGLGNRFASSSSI